MDSKEFEVCTQRQFFFVGFYSLKKLKKLESKFTQQQIPNQENHV